MHMDVDAVKIVRRRLTVQLPPAALADVKSALVRHLKMRLGRFDSDMDGIVLDYKNVKILNDRGLIKHDSADIQLDIEADFHAFRPEVGVKLRGVINKKCITHLSVLVHKIFNVVIPRPTEAVSDWLGDKLEIGQNILFTIVTLDLFGLLPYIRGELDENCSIEPLDDEKEKKTSTKITPAQVNFDGTKPRLPCSSDSDSKSNGVKKRKRKPSSPEPPPTKKKKRDSSSLCKSTSTDDDKSEEKPQVKKRKKNIKKDSSSDSDSSSDEDLDISTKQSDILKKIMKLRKCR